MTEQEIRNLFAYHSPNPKSVKVHEFIRESITKTVLEVADKLPDSYERGAFIRKMQQAQMMAHASIAINGLPWDN